ncbi:hypothetical protein CBW65_03580 [Tumebacillus avium]|uniref:Carrier domain-containing protein n=1 Tax=Tumebacillus avium TaxID=1903704 RepID=A0A1Y0ILD9_9BACL|nr:non-ribosomal peptide synthetase [Tumebacillus avium]ARU60243.1 hypothetical protein CBW65_03580 [Tumebacillus avium]
MDRYTQNMMLTSSKFAPEREYWSSQLAGELVLSAFPPDRLRASSAPYRKAAVQIALSDAASAHLNRLSNGSPLGLFMGLLVGVNYLLYRYTASVDLLVGMPGLKGSGHFALRTKLEPADTGKDLLLRVKEAVSAARKYGNIPFQLLQEQLDISNRNLLPLFCTVVQLEGLHQTDGAEALQADTVFTFAEQDGQIVLNLDYNEHLYDRVTIEALAAHLDRLLAAITGEINRPLAEIDMLSAAERDAIILGFNDTQEDYPADSTLHDMMSRQAAQTPDAPAILSEAGNLTYRELDERSSQIAHWLVEQGVASGELVGVIAKRTPQTLVNIFGILKAGGVYVPVDPDHPEERRKLILETSNCRLLLEPDLYEREGLSALQTDGPQVQTPSSQLAYVLYTSGSTGVPKGVAITHRNALNTVLACSRKFAVGAGDRLIGISSFCFDLSVFDIFGTMSAGAALVLVPNQRDIPKIVELAEKYEVTVWNSVPAILNLACGLIEEGQTSEKLRLIMLSGDWIPLELFGKATGRFVNARFISLGGPTETSIWSIHYPVTEIKSDWVSIPYGMPMPNQQIYILNSDLQVCPYGVEGELYIGGDGVGAGYLNDPERTAAFFIEHPQFGRLYKSGDFGALQRAGHIKLSGRKDFQIKIRGFRIDTKEIQSTLLKIDGVTAAAVVARGEGAENKHLVAYLVAEPGVSIPFVRNFLAARLPDYMVPSYFVPLDAMPLSANSKVDLNQLPEPDLSQLATGAEYEAPRNEVETKLVSVFQDVLGVEKIGVHDNFFALGGTSIKALQAVTRLSAEYPVEMGDIFERQTAANLAELIQGAEQVQPKHNALLRIQGGEQTPLFMVHPVSGIAYCYTDLARGLSGQPFYGLQAPSLQAGQEPITTLEEIAACYVEAVRTVQPQGPYLLGGWSMGGVVAFEMAEQFRALGETVELIAMIDSYVPALSELPDDEQMVREFAADLAGRFGVEIGDRAQAFQGVEQDAMLRYVLEQAHAQDVLPASFELEDLKRYFAVFKTNVEAYRRYEPTGRAKRIVLYRATQHAPASGDLDPTHGFRELAEEIEVVKMEADHFTIVQAPHVFLLADHLSRELRKTHEQSAERAETV